MKSEKVKKTKALASPIKINFPGWKLILVRVYNRIGEDNISIAAGGIAFFAFLAIFPALIALLSIYGLIVDPQLAEQQIALFSKMLPKEAYLIIEKRIENLLSTSGTTLGWGTVLGILFSLWSANKGTKSLFNGLDIAYKTKNERSILKHNVFTFVFTLGAVLTMMLSMMLIVIFPAAVQTIGLPGYLESLISWFRWPLLAFIVILGISFVYKYAPDRQTPKYKWVILGASLATLFWLIASWGFSFFVGNFGNYGEMYGSISAVAILLLWLFITSYIILLGGELNSATEDYVENTFKKRE
jgi:membrane protein